MTNDERADLADDALEVMQDDDRPNQICDLMVSLMHLAEREGMCVNGLIRRVQMHYDAEAIDAD